MGIDMSTEEFPLTGAHFYTKYGFDNGDLIHNIIDLYHLECDPRVNRHDILLAVVSKAFPTLKIYRSIYGNLMIDTEMSEEDISKLNGAFTLGDVITAINEWTQTK